MQITEINPKMMNGIKPPIDCPENAVIAGGAIRRWFVGREELSDVDVFFKSEEDLKKYEESLEKIGFKIAMKGSNASTYERDRVLVQCIKIKYYQNIQDLFDMFDYTVCQFAWDGQKIYTTSEALISVLRGHLAVHKITKEYSVDSLRRAFKYAKKGYWPCLGTLQEISNSITGLTKEEIEKQVVVSPGGGTRSIGVD